MKVEKGRKGRKRVQVAGAFLLLVAGATAFFVRGNPSSVRALGIGACLVAIYLVGLTRDPAAAQGVKARQEKRPARGQARGRARIKKRPGRRLWAVSIALLPTLGLSYLYLYEDGVRGYPDVLPVYLFGGVAVVCTLVWSYMAARVW